MLQNLLYLAIVNLLITYIGYWFVGKKMVISSWVQCLTAVAIIHFIFLTETPVIRMFALISTAFTGMKVITTTIVYRDRPSILTFTQWLAFVFTWAGMRAEIFEQIGAKSLPGTKQIILNGLSKIAIGLLLILASHKLVMIEMHTSIRYILITSILLIAFSLILHFGVLTISAGVWRYFGVDTYYLFREPLKATTLNEFWSKRWNIAFSEMTSIAVFRPLKQRVNAPVALLAAFIFSGLLHELAISVPVNSGYGLPMIYFVIQGLAVSLEKILIQRKVLDVQKVVIGKIWLLLWLVVPLPHLFHRAFVTEIIWPLAGLHLR
jgi:hypothetical protein